MNGSSLWPFPDLLAARNVIVCREIRFAVLRDLGEGFEDEVGRIPDEELLSCWQLQQAKRQEGNAFAEKDEGSGPTLQ